MNLSEIVLLRPWWLLVVPAVVALAILARRRGGLGDWRRAVDPALMAYLERRGAVADAARRGLGLSPWLVAAAVIALALAGPAVERPAADTFHNLDGLVVALDVSRSVVEGGALDDAKAAVAEVIAAAGARQTALVLFAGDAYRAAAFTADRAVVLPILAAATGDYVPDAGSRPVRAIALASALFGEAGMLGGDLVVVTDGGGADGDADIAAERLAASGRRVHVLAVPTPALPAGAPAADPAAAARLAAAGGGAFATAEAPAAVVAAVARPTVERLGRAGYAALAWADLGRVLLVAAALPLLLVFRRPR